MCELVTLLTGSSEDRWVASGLTYPVCTLISIGFCSIQFLLASVYSTDSFSSDDSVVSVEMPLGNTCVSSSGTGDCSTSNLGVLTTRGFIVSSDNCSSIGHSSGYST